MSSSPLILGSGLGSGRGPCPPLGLGLGLGADLSDAALVDRIVGIIGNTEAIAINQVWVRLGLGLGLGRGPCPPPPSYSG